MKVTTTIHMGEAEVARDLHAVLAQAQQGIEIVIEQDHRPIAVIKQPPPVGRMISEILADLKRLLMTISYTMSRKGLNISGNHGPPSWG